MEIIGTALKTIAQGMKTIIKRDRERKSVIQREERNRERKSVN